MKVDDPVRFLDERTNAAGALRSALRYTFPEHWSFMLGELALYSFVTLVATGTYLALFYEPSSATTVYDGPYALLQGREVTEAYDSVLTLSFEVDAGLLLRQTHHWAALVFVAAIAIHLMRVFFTGAYRKPRELTYFVGLTMLGLALLEGFLGYSLLDDVLSGMGLAIAYGVVESIPFVGGNLALLLWGGEFPGSDAFFSRLYIAHVLLVPALLAGLIALHLVLIIAVRHGQFRGPRRRPDTVVGVPMWPVYALRSGGFMLFTIAVLLAMGGLLQINPVWLWGPFETALSTNGAQPDWYLGWLIGALRLVPGSDVVIGGTTVVPNPFWGGLALPTAVFAFLFAWPWLERRRTGDRDSHHLLDRPRDAPARTGAGWALLVLVALVLLAGSADRVTYQTGLSYAAQLWAYRVALLVGPVLAFLVARRTCLALQDAERVEARRKAVEERDGG